MTNFLNTMLISPKMVKESGELSLNVDENVIGTCIRTAQNVYMTDVVGTELVMRLQELVWNKIKGNDDAIDDEENIAYKTLLDQYMKPALISKTVIEVAIRQSLKIRNMGVVQNSDGMNVQKASLDDIKYLQNYEETMWNHHLNRMADFLCKNKEAIPESKYDCGCKPKTRYANTNLWLG